MATNIDWIFSIKDLVSSKLNSINKTFDLITGSANKTQSAINLLPNSLQGVRQKLEKLHQYQNEAFTVEGIKHYRKEIEQTEKELAKMERIAGKKGSGNGSMGLGGTFGGIGTMAVGYLGLSEVLSFGQSVVETSAKYQKFEAVLANSMGNRAAAKQSMNDITQFASKTPFQVDELTSSFVKLYNQGFKPSMTDMTKLGDLASSTGKGFDQLTEAILDAQMGEFERLKEFGIKGKTESDKYIFSFKNQRYEVAKNAEAVKNFMLQIGASQGVAGSMGAISQTLGGQLSNLSDSWDMFKANLGERSSDAMNLTVASLGAVINRVNEWVKIPTSEKLEKERQNVTALVAELGSGLTPLERRNEIYRQLKEIAPEVVNGISAENVELGKLNVNLMNYNGNMLKKIQMEKQKEKYANVYSDYTDIVGSQAETANSIRERIMKLIDNKKNKLNNADRDVLGNMVSDPSLANDPEKLSRKAANFLNKVDPLNSTSMDFSNDAYKLSQMKDKLVPVTEKMNKMKADMDAFAKITGLDTPTTTDAGGNTTTTTPGGGSGSGNKTTKLDGDLSSISGRGIKNITINVEKLGGEITVNTQTLSESKEEIHDMVFEAIARALTDANSIGEK